jgi:hypothetical protein
MKMRTKLALVGVLGLFLSLNLTAQKPADLVGTWVGLATLEGMGDPNELTLVLDLKDGELVGHMSDQYETMIEAPISEIKLGEGEFNFSVVAMGPGGQDLTLIFKMKMDVDSMKGTLEVPDMSLNGKWEATKQ